MRKHPVSTRICPTLIPMTSIFRLIFKDFDPPPTVESASVTPSPFRLSRAQMPQLKAELANLRRITRERRVPPRRRRSERLLDLL